jgi:hypothetical protein
MVSALAESESPGEKGEKAELWLHEETQRLSWYDAIDQRVLDIFESTCVCTSFPRLSPDNLVGV